jgi:hypothetical protein
MRVHVAVLVLRQPDQKTCGMGISDRGTKLVGYYVSRMTSLDSNELSRFRLVSTFFVPWLLKVTRPFRLRTQQG